ncbi:MAG: serine hydrolase [Anaerolineales bacterium]|nr:serine hydrolase [Anaerolineales bacterium]
MTDTELLGKMDEFLKAVYLPDQPGAAVIVMKGGQVLLRKGYGLANLELGVPVEPHMVFRLGSITKQFTAVCILMLLEQGKLSLQDDLTLFLPDYPTQGRKITIEHLLTHTSGIKSYTDMPEWLPLWRKDMSLQELIAIFKDQPLEFEPGERFLYNNSGYILLGAIIEQVSGMPYAEFVQKQIFDRLGMAHSLYDDPVRLVPGRVAGYTSTPDGFANSPYLSMSQPYAAGSLASCVDDLVRWDAAQYTAELMRPETLGLAFQSAKLSDGSPTGYGFGWGISEYEGHLFIEHGGGINGFSCGGVRVPDFQVYVAVLTNLDAPKLDPSMVAFQLATMAIGKPYTEPVPIELPLEALDSYVGVYQIKENEERVVTRDGSKVYSQRTGGMRLELIPYAEDAFFIKEAPDRFFFDRAGDGQVEGMRVVRRFGPPDQAKKTDKPLPQLRPVISLKPALLERYAGIFELAPGMAVIVSLAEGQLFIQAPGQEKLALFAETPERLFPREVDLTLVYEFDPDGAVTSFVLHQGNQSYPCKKVG